MKTGSVNSWHELFDAICIEQGHVDNVKLAAAICDIGKNNAPGAFDSALKSLGNWRQGKHTPNRRNFRLLTIILEIDEKGDRAVDWRSLYEQALRRKPAEEDEGNGGESAIPDEAANAPDGTASAPASRSSRRPLHYAAVVAGAALVTFSVFYFTEFSTVLGRDTRGITTLPVDMTGQQIYYREQASLKVGESIVVHGKRGHSCAVQPPEWPDVIKFLPELSTGVWSDGGVGFRVSRSCGGATPARAVVFTATRPGMDKFMLYDDPITITVD
ncbi:MAG: hypothetical protein RJQ21_12965 [Rhodospirillales bacterium]